MVVVSKSNLTRSDRGLLRRRWTKRWLALVAGMGRLVGVSDPEQRHLIERFAKQREPNRQVVAREPPGEAERGYAHGVGHHALAEIGRAGGLARALCQVEAELLDRYS